VNGQAALDRSIGLAKDPGSSSNLRISVDDAGNIVAFQRNGGPGVDERSFHGYVVEHDQLHRHVGADKALVDAGLARRVGRKLKPITPRAGAA
jgi:hypothetical protein